MLKINYKENINRIGNIKKIHRNNVKSIIILSIFFLIPILYLNPSYIKANTEVQELQQKIEEKNRNIEALNAEIKQYEALTDKTSQEARTLQSRIQQLEQNARSIDLDIKKIRERIDLANLDIKRLNLNITESEQKIKDLKYNIESSIKNIYQVEHTNLIQIFLNNKNLSSMLSEVNTQLSFTDSLKNLIDKTREERGRLEGAKENQESRKNELVRLESDLSGKKQAVTYAKNEQSDILKETKNQEKEYQRILKEKQALKASVEKELFEYESQLKYTLDPTSLPKAGSNSLEWPLDNVRITQQFGRTVAAQRLYVSGSHNGVDFGAPIGTPVKSVQSGVVLGAGDTDLACKGASFGRWILVRHNNGLASLYAHLSVINVTAGQQVRVGETIGLSGNTGYSTGPHLHLSVYAADAVKVETRPSISCRGKIFTMPIAPIQAYLDPLLYLPKR
jgi:murein DD-endopeptidase MepM/ murein hydrolase activator NlpD